MEKFRIIVLFLTVLSCSKHISVKAGKGLITQDYKLIQAANCTIDFISSLSGNVYSKSGTNEYYTNTNLVSVDSDCNETKVNYVWYRVGSDSAEWILADGVGGDFSKFSLSREVGSESRVCIRSGIESEPLGMPTCYEVRVDQSAPVLAFVGPTPQATILISAPGEPSGIASLYCSLTSQSYDMIIPHFSDIDCTGLSVDVLNQSGHRYELTVVATDNVGNESTSTYNWGVAARTVVPTCEITGIRGTFPQDGKNILRSSYVANARAYYFNDTELYVQVDCSGTINDLEFSLNGGTDWEMADGSEGQSKFEFPALIENQSEFCIRPRKDMSFGDDVCYQFNPNTLPPSGAYTNICYEDWKKAVFSLSDYSNVAVSASDANPQSDGIDNLKKFAFVGNPHVNQSSNFSQMYFNGSATFSANVAGKTYGFAQNLNVSATPKTADIFFFVRPNSCLKYEFQGSSNLSTWTTIASYDGATGTTVGTMSVVVTPVDASTSKVLMTNLSLGTAPAAFFRFKITQN